MKPLLLKWTAAFYRNRPLASWPARMGSIHDISVPCGVKPHATPQPVGGANINSVIDLFERARHITGDVAECGVFRGGTLIPLAVYMAQKRIAKTLYGFDSFEGFPESIATDLQLGGADLDYKRPGGMNQTSRELVANKARLFGLKNVRIFKGFFGDTLPEFSALSFSFVHLDCDTYDSYRECLSFFYPRVPRGGIILFDEYNDPPWPGCNKAIDEYLVDRPERCQAIAHDNYVKYYIVKQ